MSRFLCKVIGLGVKGFILLNKGRGKKTKQLNKIEPSIIVVSSLPDYHNVATISTSSLIL